MGERIPSHRIRPYRLVGRLRLSKLEGALGKLVRAQRGAQEQPQLGPGRPARQQRALEQPPQALPLALSQSE